MVFVSIYEHASSVIIFASTSSRQIFLASNEHFRKYRWRASLEKYRWRIVYVVLRQVIANNQADTSKTEQKLQAELS